MSSSLDEMLNELRAHFDRMGEELKRSFDELHTTLLETSFSEIHSGLDKLNTSVGERHSSVSELHASTQKLDVALDSLSESVDKMTVSTKALHARIQAIDDKFNIDIPFYLGCYTVFLGSVVSAISGKHQPQNVRSVGAFVFGAGLIATGGYLIANSLFKKDKPTPKSEDNEQSTELNLVNSTN